MSTVPDRARIVIIGGGILGCSIAYWLTKYGERDVVLVEQPVAADDDEALRGFAYPAPICADEATGHL